jgi:hypothetical protein
MENTVSTLIVFWPQLDGFVDEVAVLGAAGGGVLPTASLG